MSISASSITVRPAAAEDEAALLAAIEQLQDYEVPLHDSRLPGHAVAAAYREYLARRVEQAGGCLLVAHSEGQFAGFIAGWIERDDLPTETADSNVSGYISDVFVAESVRGRGIAGRLFTAIEGLLAGHGVTRVRIRALAANETARAAYIRLGYAPYEVLFEKRI